MIISPYFLDQPVSPPLWRDEDLIRPRLPGGDQYANIAAIHQSLAREVEATARAGEPAICIGGDCLQAIGVMAGLQRAGISPVVVWLDAHGDFNTPETTPSGFIGGMPLAMLVGRGDERLTRAAKARTVAEGDVILADARDLDPGERAALERSGVRRSADLSKVPRMLPGDRPVYVHFDPDIINTIDAPAMLYPTAGGPSAADVAIVARALFATGRVVAASMTMWEFAKDPDGRTERACLGAFGALTGTAPS